MLALDAPLKLFAFAGASACCGELVSHPFDVAKTRLQLAGRAAAAAGAPPRFTGTLQALAATAAGEGPRALYSGIRPALLRQATYGSLRVGLYPLLLERVVALSGGGGGGGGGGSPALAQRAAAGALAGALSAAACSPTDLVKVRMQAHGSGVAGSGAPRYAGVLQALRAIAAAEGAAGLWRGWAPTAQRAALVAAAELAGYEALKEALVAWGGAGGGGAVAVHLAASLGAGAAASALSSPWDVVRVRVMEGGGGGGGAWACARALVAQEGLRGLLAGVPADFARRGPHTVVSFVVLEQLRARWGGGGGASR